MADKPNRLAGLMTPSKGQAAPARMSSYNEADEQIDDASKTDTNQPIFRSPTLLAPRPVTQGKVAMSLRFGTDTYDRLKELSFKTGLPVQRIIDQAVQAYLETNVDI